MRTPCAAVLAGALLAGACAPRLVPVPVVTKPSYPAYVRPSVPEAFASSGAAAVHARAWQFLQAGDLRNAEREVEIALRSEQGFYPGEALAGYVELARGDEPAALERFDRALERAPEYAPALAGRGFALTALEREAEAADAFEAALAVDPSLVDLGRQVEVLRFRGLQRQLDAARTAAKAALHDEAVTAYHAAIAMSPDSAVLYRELAASERQRGNADAALETFRKAAELDPTDPSTHLAIGELLEARGDSEGALGAYAEALAHGADEKAAARRDALLERINLARLPEEFRAIETASQVTRADLAALLGVRMADALPPSQSGNASLMTDVRGHWAEPWIMSTVNAGVLETFANHTFQPRAVVRRVDLAQAVSRVLQVNAAPARLAAWRSAPMTFSDVSPSHLAYAAVSLAVAAGAMRPTADNAFQPGQPVTGREALEVVDRVRTLVQ